MQLKSYASDLLEDAMILAQTKAMNSFSFRDTINSLTELWGYCYERIAQIDPGYYSCVIRLTEKLTRLPSCVKSVIRVFSSRELNNFDRKIYKVSGMNDLRSPWTYHVSGREVYCFDADIRPVWLEYLPEPPLVTFTKDNRNAKVLEREKIPVKELPRYFGVYELVRGTNTPDEYTSFVFQHRSDTTKTIDLTEKLMKEDCTVVSFILDCPWAFITYKSNTMGEYASFLISDLLGAMSMERYNPYDFTGRGSNIEYLKVRYNDYTGMEAVVLDHEDLYQPEPVDEPRPRCKVLGWTPDTLLCYPSRVMYNYMVATLAQRFAALNGSTVMAVELALANANDEMGQWMKKDKSAWMRANNVTGPTISDFLG